MGIDPQDRIGPQRLHLSSAQLDYVTGTGLSDYQYDEDDETVTNAINSVVTTLPDRIQYLIEDLSALHRNQFLDGRHQAAGPEKGDIAPEVPDQDLLSQLLEVTRNDELFDPPTSFLGIPHRQLRWMELGVHLGHLLYMPASNSDLDVDYSAVIAGFMLGSAGKWLDESYGVGQADLWLQQLEGPLSESLDNISDARTGLLEAIYNSMSEIGLHEKIEDRLTEAGLEPVFPLVAEVYQRIIPTISDPASENQYISPRQIGQLNLSDVIWPEIADLKGDESISRADELAKVIYDDIQVLKEKSWRQRIPELDVLAAYWLCTQTDEEETPKSLLKQKHGKCSQQSVNKHLNDLAGTGKTPEPWDEYPLIRDRDQDALTAYGKLLTQLVVGRRIDLKYEVVDEIAEPSTGVFDPEDQTMTRVPDQNEVKSGCYAFALDHLQSGRSQDVFQNAYQERIGSTENGGSS